ncbi:MAG TPA: hypothetical protein VF622_14405 [Segetibacter sp.]|jgi:uncharacterized membrane protein
MKKLFIAALLTVTVATSAFTADDKKIDSRIIRNFNSEYADADKVTWSVKSSFVKASFEVDGQQTDAFYNFNGESIGCSRRITLDNLPLQAKRTFAKRYSDYTVKEAIKFDGNDESAYFISAENDKYSVILKITGAGLSVFKRTNKN